MWAEVAGSRGDLAPKIDAAVGSATVARRPMDSVVLWIWNVRPIVPVCLGVGAGWKGSEARASRVTENATFGENGTPSLIVVMKTHACCARLS